MQGDMNSIPAAGADAIETLIEDHQRIKSLLSDLTKSTQSSSRMQTLERLKALLTVHNATEENLIYPALREVAGKKSESLKLYNETAEADVLVFTLDTMLKEGRDDDFGKTAGKLQAAILEHIEDEEEKAFPHLQKGAQPQQAQLLNESVRQFRGSLRFDAAGGRAQPGAETGEIGSQAPMEAIQET